MPLSNWENVITLVSYFISGYILFKDLTDGKIV